jgi:hypothetical protein
MYPKARFLDSMSQRQTLTRILTSNRSRHCKDIYKLTPLLITISVFSAVEAAVAWAARISTFLSNAQPATVTVGPYLQLGTPVSVLVR